MTGDLLEILWRANLVAVAAIFAVIALRWPVARMFGATARYGLWCLVPVAVLAAFLPARLVTADASLFAAPAEALAQAQVYFIQFARPAAEATALPDPRALIAGLWLAGAFAAGFLLWRRQRAFELSAGVGELGPAVVGFIRPRIHLPRDFEAAFTPEEQAVILAHEETHLARQDARINGVVAAVQCAFWFNPFVHLGAHLMRLDQEMACDEAVLARRPGARRAYAQAMLKTQLTPTALTLGCYWPARAQSALESRIAMLKSKTPGRARRIAGAATVALLACSGGYAALAASAQDQQEPAAQVSLPTTVNLSNAGTGEVLTWGSQRGTPAQIRAAVEAGDVRQAFALGGTAQEVARAMAANGGPLAELFATAEDVAFVTANGRTGVRARMPEADGSGRERYGVLLPPELETVTPPPGAQALQAGAGGRSVSVPAAGGAEDIVVERFVLPQ